MSTEGLTLEDVRAQAKEKLKGFCMVYKDCDGAPSRFCQGQHYGRSLGIGGMGSGASFHNNWLALRKLQLKTKLISEHFEPDTTFTCFGKQLTMPIMAASVAGVNSFGGEKVITEQAFCQATVQGCNEAGTIAWRGDTYTYSINRNLIIVITPKNLVRLDTALPFLATLAIIQLRVNPRNQATCERRAKLLSWIDIGA